MYIICMYTIFMHLTHLHTHLYTPYIHITHLYTPLYTPIHTLLKAEECIECEKGTFANAYESHTCTDCDAGKCLFI